MSSKKEERKEGNESMEENKGKLEKFPLSAARARAEVEARERIRGEKRRKGRDERGTLYSSSTPYSSSESLESRSFQAA